MISQIEIANQALSLLGVSGIESFDEESEQARQISLFYNTTLQEVLREGCWKFPKKTVQLALVEEKSKLWRYMYAYPSDCLKALRVICPQTRDTYGLDKFDVSLSQDNVRLLGCDVDQALLQYIANITDTSLFTPDFTECLVFKLAAKISHSATGNPNYASDFLQKYVVTVSNAVKVAANEGHDKPKEENDYVSARY